MSLSIYSRLLTLYFYINLQNAFNNLSYTYTSLTSLYSQGHFYILWTDSVNSRYEAAASVPGNSRMRIQEGLRRRSRDMRPSTHL